MGPIFVPDGKSVAATETNGVKPVPLPYSEMLDIARDEKNSGSVQVPGGRGTSRKNTSNNQRKRRRGAESGARAHPKCSPQAGKPRRTTRDDGPRSRPRGH